MNRLVLAAAIALTALHSTAQASRVCRVDDDSGTSVPDGRFWTRAYRYLQDALVNPQCTEIWIASGIYYPDVNSAQGDTNDPRKSFKILHGQKIYGGFAGTETEASQRNWENNVVVLSGDITQDDVTDSDGIIIDASNINGTNAAAVVCAINAASAPTIDGIVITAGNQLKGRQNACIAPFSPNGGGLVSATRDTNIANVRITGNRATFGGGMQNSYGGRATLKNVIFSGNVGDEGCGGLASFESTISLDTVAFTNNTASAAGGGMCNYWGGVDLSNVLFRSNRVLIKKGSYGDTGALGGGFANFTNVDDSSLSTLRNLRFENNLSEGEAGGMYTGGNTSVRNVSFHQNTASTYGGGLYATGPMLSLTNVRFINNAVTDVFSYGGGLFVDGSDPITLQRFRFEGNSAQAGGGGAAFFASARITQGIFQRNRVREGGGGGLIAWYTAPSIELTDVRFLGNTASTGGGMSSSNYSVDMTNVVFAGNQAQLGGGMVTVAAAITNTTFAGNEAIYGGGLSFYDEGVLSELRIGNTIFWDNAAISSPSILTENDGDLGVGFSLIQGSGGSGNSWGLEFGVDLGGNLDTDPRFLHSPDRGSDGKWGTKDDDYGDLRLQAGSPAVDAGDNLTTPVGVTADIDGYPRLVNEVVDMGPHEAQGN